MKNLFGVLLVAAGLTTVPASDAAAQDDRWGPWLGCWELVNERIREPVSPAGVAHDVLSQDEVEPVETAVSSPLVCVTRAGDNGVTLTTTVPGQEPVEQTIVANGLPHPIADGDCRGTESSEWSSSGRRLFARAQVTCADGPREISGLTLLTPDDTWLDVRSFRAEGQSTTRVSRYRRAPGTDAVRRIPPAGGAALSIADITEASTKVTPAVLEAVLVETNPNLPVNRHTLVELADAGVAPRVLDVMVALAYPEHFVVERADSQVAAAAPPPYVPYGPYGPYGPYDYYYSGYYYPAWYYSPFGFAYIGRYDPYFFGPGVYPVPPGRPVQPLPDAGGRAINREGYTRIRPAGDDPAPDATATGRAAGRRPTAALVTGSSQGSPSSGTTTRSSGGSSGGSSDGGTSSGGGSGSASPGGFSAPGGGDGGGRTAQPR